MSEGFTSRAFRLTFSYSSWTPSFSSYICLPAGDFWEGTSRLEQIGLSAVPVEGTLCWSLAPSTTPESDSEEMSRRRSISIETFGVDELDEEEVEDSEYIPFVVGTSVVASGVIKLSLLNTEVRGSKNSVRLYQPTEQDGTLKVIYDFRPEGNAVLIPWIPSLLTPADFLAFIRDAQGIVDIRLVRDASPGKYMALIRLNSRRHALRFAEQFSGRPFSPLEPDLCQVLWMAEIEFVTRVVSIVPLFDLADFKESVHILPISEHEHDDEREVPSCPVCLERLDSSVTGIITTICSHSYHCGCMLKWYDGSCPVCRFLLSEEDEKDRSQCTECGCRENLWVCLICGNIGCGRYRSKHAEGHFSGTGHTFSLELETHRVWDYVGDNYVHRLVQNQDDGKLIEISHPASPEPTSDGTTKKKSEDPDYISSLLVAQLESQRVYYEEKLSALEVSWSHQNKSAQSEANIRIESLEVSIKQLEATSTAEYKKMKHELSILEDRIEVLKKEKAALQKALEAESAMLDRVMANQQGLEETIREKDSAITDLQEQIADLLMHIEGQKAVAQSDIAEELRIGSISLVDAPLPKCKKPIRRKR